MLIRTLVAARRQLLKMVLQMANQIRGLMKTFGLVVPKGMGRIFDHHVRSLLASHAELERIILPLLEAWRDMRAQTAKLSRQVVVMARESTQCRLLTSIPGVGAIMATAFAAAIEDPGTFTTSRSVGAWVGLTPRRYQSGEVDYDGHISRRGPRKSASNPLPPSSYWPFSSLPRLTTASAGPSFRLGRCCSATCWSR